MSKRYIFPQQSGDRKKAKLDVTVSDHNFPLSQNLVTDKGGGDQLNTWGDDNDDEILLLASQACEDAYNDQNNSTLPDYSICMQPSSTSTQISEPVASTSLAGFTFKKPTSSPLSLVTTRLRNKCEKISSPLPGIAAACKTDGVNVSDDIILNDNIYKGQDSDHIYRQLLKLQEENAKLKSENGKLLEKCVTKEGEASILRTQLKTCQVTVDNARLEKVQAQEKAQMEWSEKLTAAQNKMQDLKNQLDFKNLEIISIKEKCKFLESNKVKLTQVMVTGNDISMSQRHSTSVYGNDSHIKKLKTVSNSVQTEDKLHFLKFNIPTREDTSQLTQVLPLIMEPTTEKCSILDYNEKLNHPMSNSKCRVFSTFHRLPTTPAVCKENIRKKLNLKCIYENITNIAAGMDSRKDTLEILEIVRECLSEVCIELEIVLQRLSTAFQRDMDERYIDVTRTMLIVNRQDLLSGTAIYKEEQGILARRIIAILVYILDHSRCEDLFEKWMDSDEQSSFMNVVNKICTLLDDTSCAVLYSGFLSSITWLLRYLLNRKRSNKLVHTVRTIILSRPMPFVSCQLLALVGEWWDSIATKLCCKGVGGNLRIDYDQGVLMYKKDSCTLQVLLKQIEAAYKCMERQCLVRQAADCTRGLILMYSILDINTPQGKQSCECGAVCAQLVVYALRVCAHMLPPPCAHPRDDIQRDILSLCRSGVRALYGGVSRDAGFGSRLGHAEGQLVELCEILRRYRHPDMYNNMLSEITNTFQSSPEEPPTAYKRQAWIASFKRLYIAD